MVIVKFKDKEHKFKFTADELTELVKNGFDICINGLIKSNNANLMAVTFGSVILAAYVPESGKKNYISMMQFQNSACYRHLWKELALNVDVGEKFMKYIISPRAKYVLELKVKS